MSEEYLNWIFSRDDPERATPNDCSHPWAIEHKDGKRFCAVCEMPWQQAKRNSAEGSVTMGISTFERDASVLEMAVEVDRRGAAIERLEAERDHLANLNKDAHACVARIWAIFGTPTYEQLNGRSIYDMVRDLKDREEAAQAALARLRKVRDGYADQAKFADHEPAAYFREFVRRVDGAING